MRWEQAPQRQFPLEKRLSGDVVGDVELFTGLVVGLVK
jgi:hypothetical protein